MSYAKIFQNYKPPLNSDIPMDFRVTLLKNAAHSSGVLRSKGWLIFYFITMKIWSLILHFCFHLATGEPPLCMSVSVFFALRNAVDAARSDAGDSAWYQMGTIKCYIFICLLNTWIRAISNLSQMAQLLWTNCTEWWKQIQANSHSIKYLVVIIG